MQRLFTQESHDAMVRSVFDYLRENGYTDIRVDLTGTRQPFLIFWTGQEDRGHIPDVTAHRGGKFYLIEIETTDSINDQHTADQWKLFSAHATQHNGEFWIVVPDGAEATAEQRRRSLNITAAIKTT